MLIKGEVNPRNVMSLLLIGDRVYYKILVLLGERLCQHVPKEMVIGYILYWVDLGQNILF